ncbi:MAG: universal stress protein [Desulfarculaceae bacterium]|nr:universal stress protein [Desulfarculaceae bacterium]MCF8070778.1 universal stress protein [Desulfarculaceae bacterium]MCF8102215.1 universal stress protein [Desulfarculaceae bacterium]MCF8116986.1 universal stress protein [Desulfarculaceae bacterium]
MNEQAQPKLMICGDGPVARELLKRLGERWLVTLVGPGGAATERAVSTFAGTARGVAGDPSSPVVLEEAGLASQDYVLALGPDDQVNLAVVQAASEAKVGHILAIYYEAVNRELFSQCGAEALLASAALARELHHFLQNPGVRVSPLALGQGAVLEMDTGEAPHLVGRLAGSLRGRDWRLSGLVRGERLVLPSANERIQAGDRLVMLGQADMFSQICADLSCGLPGFPLSWGHTLLVVLTPKDPDQHEGLLTEGLFWALNSRVEQTIILCRGEQSGFQDLLDEWPAAASVRVESVPEGLLDHARRLCEEEKVGLVVLGKYEPTWLSSLGRGALMDLAESLCAPVVFSGGTAPYRKILVPFDGGPKAEAALEVAAEVAQQTGGELSTALVEEPEFIRGGDGDAWLEKARARAKEMAHGQKLKLAEVSLQGNPVHQISAISGDYDLMVVGGSSRGRGLFSPNVGEHLAQKAACSVLVVAEKG